MPNPYITMPTMAQDVSGLSPVYQNMAQQQQFQNMMSQQGNQLAQQAGQAQQGGLSPMALAMALRKSNDPYAANKGDPYANAQTASNIYGAENVYGYGGQGQVPVWNGEM
jgi:hypothetical protein